MSRLPLPYSPSDERIEPDEQALFERIAGVMRAGGAIARDGDGPGGRLSHVKTLAALKGELHVAADLAPELAQGLFARPKSYPVIARLSHLPAERLDDRGVSSPRGLALKLLDVDGVPLAGHAGRTQDFVLETAPAFNVSSPRAFLAAIGAVEAAAPLPQRIKSGVSAAARGANAALGAVGLASANLDVLGHPRRHPLAESYYSQVPLRWGDHVAKLGVFPARELRNLEIDLDEADALSAAIAHWFAEHPVEFTVAAQLRTDADRMPIEDASTVWPERLSPYRPVARLVFEAQDVQSPARVAAVDALAFSPAHTLELHRPLGGVMRARMHVYQMLGHERRQMAGAATSEPISIADIPD